MKFISFQWAIQSNMHTGI